MKKYYGMFVYDGKEYVIRFKIANNFTYSEQVKCFVNRHYYVRTVADVILRAVESAYSISERLFGFASLLSYDDFVKWRKHGVDEWMPGTEIIIWV